VTSEPVPSTQAPPGLHWRLVWLLLGLALATVIVDQVTKAIVVANMFEGEEIVVVPNFFLLIFVRNPGAAFGMVSGQTWIFSILAVGVTAVVIWTLRKIKSTPWAVVFGLLLGGTVGNLLDRLFREPGFGIGHVVDFLNLPWLMPAIFNVADIAISTAAVMFILLMLLGIGIDGSRQRSRKPASAEGEHGDA
jgi:signal peptidase II